LLDRNGGRQTVDMVDVGFFHHRQELPGVGRQGFDVTALTLGIDSVKRERRFAGSREAGEHDQLIPRQAEVEIFQVVRSRAADID
jgi:hypothetical protein